MYKIICKDGRAKRATFTTVHGTVETPVFMNVGTAAAIKGAVATTDLKEIGCQIELSNTYHLHVRPGDEVVKKMGGLHKFMYWDRPILTDSGGFQVFSLAGLRKIKEEGVTFNSHVDGRKIFMGPEESMQIQSNLASTIAMAFDECAPAKAERSYVENSVARTYRWLERCKAEMTRLNSLPDTINKEQMLFGINQGAVYEDIRIDHAKRIAELDLPGYAIGGLAVGETAEEMYHILDVTVPYLPENKPVYLDVGPVTAPKALWYSGLARTEKYPLMQALDAKNVVMERLEMESSLGEKSEGYRWLALALAADAVKYAQGTQLVANSAMNKFSVTALSSHETHVPEICRWDVWLLPFVNGVMTGLFLLFSLFFIMMITNKPGEMPSILVLAASIILSVLVPAVTGALLSITSSNRAYRDMGY